MKNRKTAGGPINIVIVGSKERIHKIFTSAGWSVADKLSISKNVRIALDCIFNLSYRKAPVSKLYYLNKPQDISYQLQYGGSPRKRHHVRFWKIPEQKSNRLLAEPVYDEKFLGEVKMSTTEYSNVFEERRQALTTKLPSEIELCKRSNKEVWVGAVSFDKKIKFNRVTKKFTHKISPDVDKERDLIVKIFKKHGFKATVIDKFQTKLCGKNGEGDYYYTDGKLALLQN